MTSKGKNFKKGTCCCFDSKFIKNEGHWVAGETATFLAGGFQNYLICRLHKKIEWVGYNILINPTHTKEQFEKEFPLTKFTLVENL